MFSAVVVALLVFIFVLWLIIDKNLGLFSFKMVNFANKSLPYDYIENDCLVDHKGLTQLVYKITPVDYSAKTDGHKATMDKMRHNLWRFLAEHNITARVFLSRSKYNNPIKTKLSHSKLINAFLTKVANFFKVNYKVLYYLQLSMPKQESSNAMAKKLQAIVSQSLGNYAQKLSDADLVEFVYIKDQMFAQNHLNIGKTKIQATAEKHFCMKTGVTTLALQKNTYVKSLVLAGLEDNVQEDFIFKLSRLPFNFSIQVLASGTSKFTSLNPKNLPHQVKQVRFGFNGAVRAKAFEALIAGIKNDEYLEYTMQIWVNIFADSKAQLDDATLQFLIIAKKYGLYFKAPLFTAKALYLNTLANHNQMYYPQRVTSANLANLITFKGSKKGLFKSSFANAPFAWFKNLYEENYAFAFHVSDETNALGHTLILGSSGTGKTTLCEFLALNAITHNIQTYMFDRLNGCKIFCEAFNGIYTNFEHALNPLKFLHTKAPEHTAKFLQTLLQTEDPKLMQGIYQSASLIFRMAKPQKVLLKVYKEIFMPKLQDLAMPFTQGIYSKYFNGDSKGNDIFDNNLSNKLFGFDMTEVVKDPVLFAIIIDYLLQVIRLRSQGKAHLVILDEARGQLQSKIFAQKIAELFLEHRKLNGVIVACFQELQSLVNSNLSNIILEQCQTKILFPNHSYNPLDLEKLNLSTFDKEYLLKNTNITNLKPRTTLLKKGKQSLVLDLDFKYLGEILALFSSNAKDVQRQKILKERFGSAWVDAYLKEAA